MGSWGVTMRQSDYGLDLLGTIVDTRLKTVDFRTFHVADALELFKAVIIEEIRRANRGCSAADFFLISAKVSSAILLRGRCWLQSVLTTTTAPESGLYMITSVKTTIRLNTTSRTL